MAKKLTELETALLLAETLLDEPNADPDDDLRMMARQLLRRQETVERQEKALKEVDWNGKAELDLINANRDQMLKMHEEAVRRVRKLLRWSVTGSDNTEKALKVLEVLSLFHPMHAESWPGWPEGSE